MYVFVIGRFAVLSGTYIVVLLFNYSAVLHLQLFFFFFFFNNDVS